MEEGFTSKCNGCGRCCKYWDININLNDVKRLEKLGFKPDYFIDLTKGNLLLKKNKDACVFLNKDNSCTIHKKYGYDSKPDVCKKFPYGMFICGEIIKGKHKETKTKNSPYFIIGDKLILKKNFINSLDNLDLKKPIFIAYCGLLKSILSQDKLIVNNNITPSKDKIKIKRKLYRVLRKIILKLSSNSYPLINYIAGNKIRLILPTQNFNFKMKNVEIPERVIKKFIPYFKNQINQAHPIEFVFVFYFLPSFTKEFAGDKKISLQHVLKAFSLLCSLNRFGFLKNDRKISLNSINKNLNSWIKYN